MPKLTVRSSRAEQSSAIRISITTNLSVYEPSNNADYCRLGPLKSALANYRRLQHEWRVLSI